VIQDVLDEITSSPSPVTISIALSTLIVVICYFVFLVAPAWTSYGRVWERVAASFLTLFMLASLMMVGIVLGAAVVWTYDTWA
jgi:hypothetical protein